MELELSWHGAMTTEVGAASRHAWCVMQPGQRVKLRAEVTQLSPGELRHRLRVRRKRFGAWQTIEATPVVSGDGRPSLSLEFALDSTDLGLTARTLAVRQLELTVELFDRDARLQERACVHAYVLPARQYRIASIVRWFAFAPLIPLAMAFARDEISTAIGAWYAALSVITGIVVQEQPLARFSRVLRAATRGIVPALLTMGLLLLLEWTLLVRVENLTPGKLSVSGMQLERGQASLTWRWNAPSASHAPRAADSDSQRLAVDELAFGERLRSGQFWQSLRVCCARFDPTCETASRPARCDARSHCPHALGEAPPKIAGVELGPDCAVPPEAQQAFPIALVLGREPGSQSASDPMPKGDVLPCEGSYWVALSERLAYSGTRRARAQHAASFATLRLPGTLNGLELRWRNTVADSNGFVSATAYAPRDAAQTCELAIPVRTGNRIEIGLAGRDVSGNLRCPSPGTCAKFTVARAYTLLTANFDGLESYSVEHGASNWAPLGEAAQGFSCRCDEQYEPPKQATLRLTRAPPSSLRFEFEPGALPRRIDLVAAEHRSLLRCAAAREARIDLQPLHVSFTRSARHVEVTTPSGAWHSEWEWLEGEHQAWSCTPEREAERSPPARVDGGPRYAYLRGQDGDSLRLPNCYLEASGAVTTSEPAPPEGCSWREATEEYAKLVRRQHVCAKVMSCR